MGQGVGPLQYLREHVYIYSNFSIDDAISQVSFPNLEEMTLESLPKLKKIRYHNLSLDSFSNLRILRVKDCTCLLNLIPPHRSFKNLKEIKVERCEALEYVFEGNVNTPIEGGVHFDGEVSFLKYIFLRKISPYTIFGKFNKNIP